MPYVNGFQHDVFISYAHGDNDSGWVGDLCKTLKSRVEQYLGSGELNVWFDERKLGGNELFDTSLVNACGKSALLVCVVTPSYLNSSWCGKERAAFLANRNGAGIGDNAQATPIFKLIPLPVNHADQPDPLHRLLGFSYFDEEPQNKNWTKQFFLRDRFDLDQRFVNQTDRLAEKISDALKGLKSQRSAVKTPTRALPAGAVPAYVAECTDDAEDDRYQLANELAQFNIPVLPGDARLPIDAFDRLEAAIQAALSQCLLSVHVLGAHYGRRLACDPQPHKRSLPHLQYQLASAAGKPRVAWLPESISEESLRPEQQEFLQAIKDDKSAGTPVQYLRGSLETLKAYIRNQFPAPGESSGGDSLPSDAPVVFVSAHSNDISRSEVKQILECCRRHGCDAFTTGFGLDDEARAKREKTYLSLAQGFVILYAGADPDWVVDRVLKIRQKSQSLARKKNLLVAAVVDAPPPPQTKVRPEDLFNVQSVMVLHAEREIDSQLLDPFFNRIPRRKPR